MRINYTKDDRGYFVWRYRPAGQKPIVCKRKSLAELKKAVGEIQEDLRRGIAPSKQKTLKTGAYLIGWVDEFVKPNRAFKTYRQYEQIVRLYALPNIGDRNLIDLTSLDCQTMLNSLRTKGLSPTTISLVRTILKRAFGIAVKQQLMRTNPMDATERPKKVRKQLRAMPEEHLQLVVNECLRTEVEKIKARVRLVHRYGPLIAFLIGSGLRISEAIGLKWSDFDFEESCFHVRRKLEWIGRGQWQFSDPKTQKSYRTLPLNESALAALNAQRAQQALDKNHQNYLDNGLVFAAESGMPVIERNVQRAFDDLLKKLELPHYGLHDLRRTFCTQLARNSVPVHVAQALLGHENVATTLGHYTTPFASDMAQAVKAIDAIAGISKLSH